MDRAFRLVADPAQCPPRGCHPVGPVPPRNLGHYPRPGRVIGGLVVGVGQFVNGERAQVRRGYGAHASVQTRCAAPITP